MFFICRLSIVAGFVLMMAASVAYGSRPLVTDDASIVDPKACQLESWIQKNRGSTEYWALPACNFTGNLELTLGGSRFSDADGTRTANMTLQGNTLFKPLAPNNWGIRLVAGHVGRANATGDSQWYAYIPASFSFQDDRFRLHLNGGWLRDSQDRRNHLTWGIASETRIARHTSLLAEMFNQDEDRPSFQIGFRHSLVPERVQVDGTYGNNIGGGSGGGWFSLGLRLLSVPFLP